MRTRSLRALADVPFAAANEFYIVLTRAERRDARELAASVELAVAEHRLTALEALDPPLSLPPG